MTTTTRANRLIRFARRLLGLFWSAPPQNAHRRLMRNRIPALRWLLGNGDHSYHATSPRLAFNRVRHWLTGPQRGCSCSRCFYHPKRRVPARETYDDRVRVAALETTVRDLERQVNAR